MWLVLFLCVTNLNLIQLYPLNYSLPTPSETVKDLKRFYFSRNDKISTGIVLKIETLPERTGTIDKDSTETTKYSSYEATIIPIMKQKFVSEDSIWDYTVKKDNKKNKISHNKYKKINSTSSYPRSKRSNFLKSKGKGFYKKRKIFKKITKRNLHPPSEDKDVHDLPHGKLLPESIIFQDIFGPPTSKGGYPLLSTKETTKYDFQTSQLPDLSESVKTGKNSSASLRQIDGVTRKKSIFKTVERARFDFGAFQSLSSREPPKMGLISYTTSTLPVLKIDLTSTENICTNKNIILLKEDDLKVSNQTKGSKTADPFSHMPEEEMLVRKIQYLIRERKANKDPITLTGNKVGRKKNSRHSELSISEYLQNWRKEGSTTADNIEYARKTSTLVGSNTHILKNWLIHPHASLDTTLKAENHKYPRNSQLIGPNEDSVASVRSHDNEKGLINSNSSEAPKNSISLVEGSEARSELYTKVLVLKSEGKDFAQYTQKEVRKTDFHTPKAEITLWETSTGIYDVELQKMISKDNDLSSHFLYMMAEQNETSQQTRTSIANDTPSTLKSLDDFKPVISRNVQDVSEESLRKLKTIHQSIEGNKEKISLITELHIISRHFYYMLLIF